MGYNERLNGEIAKYLFNNLPLKLLQDWDGSEIVYNDDDSDIINSVSIPSYIYDKLDETFLKEFNQWLNLNFGKIEVKRLS